MIGSRSRVKNACLNGVARRWELDSTDLHAVARCAGTCAVYYVLVAGFHPYSFDGSMIYLQLIGLLQNWTLRFEPPLQWARYSFANSWYGIGASLALLPALMLFAPLLPFAHVPRTHPDLLLFDDPLYAPTWLATNVAATSLTVFVLGLLALRLTGSRRCAIAVALIFGLASPATVYARQDFSQPLVSLLLLGAVATVIVARPAALVSAGALAGASLGWATSARLEFLVPAAWVGMVLLWRGWREEPRRWVAVGLAFAVTLMAGLTLEVAVDLARFGTISSLTNRGTLGGNLQGSLAVGIAGLLVAPTVGFLWFVPLMVLAPAGALRLVRRGADARRFVAIAAGILALLLVVYGRWTLWPGGLSWGPRFLVPVLPYVVLLAVAGGWRTGRDRPSTLLVAVTVLQLCIVATGVLVNPLRGVGDTASWRWADSPLVRAWPVLSHRPSIAIDIFWLKAIPATSGLSAVPFAVLVILFARLFRSCLGHMEGPR